MKQNRLDEYFLLGKHRLYKIVVIALVILSIVRAYLSRWPDENFTILIGINAIIATVNTNTTTMIPWITTGSLRKALLTVEDRFGSVLSRRVAFGIVCLGSRTRYPVAEKKTRRVIVLGLCVLSWPRFRATKNKRKKEGEIKTSFEFRVVKPEQPRPNPLFLLWTSCRVPSVLLSPFRSLFPRRLHPSRDFLRPRFALDCFRIKQPWESLETTRKEGFRRFSHRCIQPEGKLIKTRCCCRIFAFQRGPLITYFIEYVPASKLFVLYIIMQYISLNRNIKSQIIDVFASLRVSIILFLS